MEGAVSHALLCWHAGHVSLKMLWSSPASYQPPWGTASSPNLQAFPSNRDHLKKKMLCVHNSPNSGVRRGGTSSDKVAPVCVISISCLCFPL